VIGPVRAIYQWPKALPGRGFRDAEAIRLLSLLKFGPPIKTANPDGTYTYTWWAE
jgi:hypothetical protein